MAEPRNPFAGMTDEEIARELADLGALVAFPATPDLARTVRDATATEPAGAKIRRFPVRKVLAAAAVVTLALVAGLLLSGGFRDAVADFFGVRGVRIVFERGTPTPSASVVPVCTPTATPVTTPAASPLAEATPVGTGLLLGQRVTLAEAQAAVPYQVQVPALASLGEPDEIYLRTLPDGNQMVSFVYFPAPGLPETLETGVGALLMQFEARDRVEYLGKAVGEGNAWVRTDLNGQLALWIEGAHQLTLVTDPSQGCCVEPERTAGNVLLWENDGVTFRLESSLEMEEAIEIAESVIVAEATPETGQSGN
jgi:hypothetical protein